MSKTYRILVVDDMDSLRSSLAANLELEGYHVVEARSGEQAIEHVAQAPFDLVLTDVRMSGLNGVDTYRAIRKIRQDLPVILMTAFSVERLLEEALGEGVYAVIMKPFSMERVIELVARAVSRQMILVVDDVVEQAAFITGALRHLGLCAEAVHDGPSAVRAALELRADVCVIDLVMPEMDGATAYEEILHHDPSIAAVAISGYSVPEMMHRMMRLGGHACLRKPFEMGDLVRSIARARGAALHAPEARGH